ncbi:peptidase inhibitor 16-like [Notolabrus celidotus]|uniref:peptidase inhibitor 16-like n=1 Tax=Notolabrus celidotus TaxID=1203425 RepID=UPI00148F58FC|nr:peptidase inhibitor 16-like [Notolabrus celidotus]
MTLTPSLQKWDPSLKVIAEGYAAKCVWNHNPDLEETGENLYAGNKPLDHREALEEWFLEHLNYDFNNNSCDEDKMCGHYTQMVWADTHRVGCAMHVCNDMEGLNWGMAYFLVCNYYPAGNYEGERPYVEGDWCSRCPENLQKCENNLCVDDTVEDMDEDVDEEEEEEDVTDIPMTTEPFLLPDQELKEEEAVLPPPATTDAYVPPPTTTAPSPAATTTPDPPRMNTDAADDSEEVQEEIEIEITPAPGTVPPRTPPTTPGPHEEVDIKTEEEEEEEEEEEVVEEVKEEEEKRQPARKAEIDVIGKIFQKQEVTKSSGSVCSSSVLLAGLMMILNLRL